MAKLSAGSLIATPMRLVPTSSARITRRNSPEGLRFRTPAEMMRHELLHRAGGAGRGVQRGGHGPLARTGESPQAFEIGGLQSGQIAPALAAGPSTMPPACASSQTVPPGRSRPHATQVVSGGARPSMSSRRSEKRGSSKRGAGDTAMAPIAPTKSA